MFTRDRSQMDPTLSWNGPFLFPRYRSAYQRLPTRDRSVIVRYCFLPVKHAQNTCCSFQNGAEVPKGTGPGVYTVTDPPKGTDPGVYTVTDPPKGTSPGVYTVTDPFGTGTVPKTGPAFLEVQFSDLIGNGLTVRLAGPV